MRINTYISSALLLLALVLWGAVGYFLYAIATGEATDRSQALDLGGGTLSHEAALRLHTLARETKGERMKLEAIANTGIIDILDTLEKTGKDAGVRVTIGRALGTEKTKGISDVHSATLQIETSGTFAEVARVVALLESLPIPSAINEVHFELLPEAPKSAPWRVVAEIQFFTTADISS